jgi:inhibitor of KinA
MPDLEQPLSIFPLGDSAITIDMSDCIDEQVNRKAVAIGKWLQDHPDAGRLDIIVAYSSVSVFYDPVKVRSANPDFPEGAFGWMRHRLEEAWHQAGRTSVQNETNLTAGPCENTGSTVQGEDTRLVIDSQRIIKMPVCYDGDFGPDLDEVSKSKGMSREEVIALHSSRIYRVYMIGFLPGFPYLAPIDARLAMAREVRPVPVMAGSVGIAGHQTGIYSLNSPGGWQIIGRTPVRLFDPSAAEPVLLKTGDEVQFFPVTPQEFDHLAPGKREG